MAKKNKWEITKFNKDGKPIVTLEADGNPLTNKDIVRITSLLMQTLNERSK